MTDTSKEAVERLAKTYDAFAAAAKIWQKATKRYDQEAADTLRALAAENERLREALEALERGDDSPDGMAGDIARAALQDHSPQDRD